MKLSRGCVPEAFKVIRKEDGRKLDCFIQNYQYMSGEERPRFNVGINGWSEWGFLGYYDEQDFNEHFDVM